MKATITAGESSAQARVVRLTDRRFAAAVPPLLAEVLAAKDAVTVGLVAVEPDGHRLDVRASATIVRSGRTWTEARGRLREERGWARRISRPPAEVVVLTPVD